MSTITENHKTQASDWFRTIRDEICTAFEALEDSHTTGPLSDRAAGRFELRETQRDGGAGGGGLMSVMRGGRLFEKVGVNISTVHGTLSPMMIKAMAARKDIPGLADNPIFWASGISLVAHMNNPKTPAVHMNTRMFWTPVAHWFGGGMDLNPMIEYPEDTAAFHKVLNQFCDKHDPEYYPKFKAWADEYFMIKHWNEPRGVGGIFYDDLNSGNWDADFAFTRDVGRGFLDAFLPITNKRRSESWTDADRETQLIKRGRYAEFNLVYDRGTHFGLQSGHDPAAVLMSMPPEAKWP
ncbi:coproporphyrinogen oxidase [Amylibacter marinus]|uniref:coproporphyrinogen oxidase n=1 Tax=Amylibacter marinus TaxID=1475483 RepID=A0ABQ5VWW4_9RHOB|nr:oxygen-dependent coproporphyrinogen oxidase [Amylibacter marinus]GLQ35593.1 coproporphyrinogen oxidase [Amylibacter marinus]